MGQFSFDLDGTGDEPAKPVPPADAADAVATTPAAVGDVSEPSPAPENPSPDAALTPPPAASAQPISAVVPRRFGLTAPGDVPDDHPIIAGLNAPQRRAVLSTDGPLLVLAGAGSGKTRALTRKISWLISEVGYRPWEILAVTFTNKAAGEMKERCHELLGDRSEGLWLGTFHAVGARMLRRHAELLGLPKHFNIYDSGDQLTMVGRVMKLLNISDKLFPTKRMQRFINEQKQQCRSPGHKDVPRDGPFEQRAAQVYEVYTKRMKAAGAVDFGDLIFLPWRLVTEHRAVGFEYQSRWRYVLVDEFQDTNKAQYELLAAVLNPERNITVVGDDDQSIYRWRGAEVQNILGFDTDYVGAEVVRLEQNYRSSGNILDVSGALIAQNRTRHGKCLWTERDAGEKVRVFSAQSERQEAEYVAMRIQELDTEFSRGEMAIFYRTNAQSRAFEEALRSRHIYYKIVGGLKFYERAEIKDILAYLKLVANPADPIAFERAVNKPARGIGKTTVETIRAAAEAKELTLWQACCGLAKDKKLSKKLTPFVELIIELRAMAEASPATQVVEEVIERTGYLKLLAADGSVEAESRADNVKELVAAIADFSDRSEDPTLTAYLEDVALVSELDRAELDDQDEVVLMTAHTAKGLEYDVAFVTGMEEDLMPHFNSSDSSAGIEEERRLAYVAMTRARHRLFLTWASSRRRFGQVKITMQSRFLDGLPSDCMTYEAAAPRRQSLADRIGGRRTGAKPRRKVADNWADASQATPSYEDFSQDPDGEMRIGSVVFHAKFGQGRVEAIDGSGERAKVRVLFVNGSTKRLIAKVLTLV